MKKILFFLAGLSYFILAGCASSPSASSSKSDEAYSSVPENPLVTAAYNGEMETVRKLLKEGADANAIGMLTIKEYKVPSTALVADIVPRKAVEHSGNVDWNQVYGIAKILLEAGANPNLNVGGGKTKLKASPLWLAVGGGSVDFVKLLLDHGAKVDFSGGMPGTPLCRASPMSYPDVVKILIDHGADPNAKCEGHTPLDYAIGTAAYHGNSGGYQQVIDILTSHGAKPGDPFPTPEENDRARERWAQVQKDDAERKAMFWGFVNGVANGVAVGAGEAIGAAAVNSMNNNNGGGGESGRGPSNNPAANCPPGYPVWQGGHCYVNSQQACKGVYPTCKWQTAP